MVESFDRRRVFGAGRVRKQRRTAFHHAQELLRIFSLTGLAVTAHLDAPCFPVMAPKFQSVLPFVIERVPIESPYALASPLKLLEALDGHSDNPRGVCIPGAVGKCALRLLKQCAAIGDWGRPIRELSAGTSGEVTLSLRGFLCCIPKCLTSVDLGQSAMRGREIWMGGQQFVQSLNGSEGAAAGQRSQVQVVKDRIAGMFEIQLLILLVQKPQMAFDAVFVDCVLIPFVREEIVRMAVAHGTKWRCFVQRTKWICHRGRKCGGLSKLGPHLRRGIASRLAP